MISLYLMSTPYFQVIAIYFSLITISLACAGNITKHFDLTKPTKFSGENYGKITKRGTRVAPLINLKENILLYYIICILRLFKKNC